MRFSFLVGCAANLAELRYDRVDTRKLQTASLILDGTPLRPPRTQSRRSSMPCMAATKRARAGCYPAGQRTLSRHIAPARSRKRVPAVRWPAHKMESPLVPALHQIPLDAPRICLDNPSKGTNGTRPLCWIFWTDTSEYVALNNPGSESIPVSSMLYR